jgi:hypothetical protein
LAKYLGSLTVSQYDSLLTDAYQLGFKVAGHAPASGVRGAVATRMASIEHIEAFIRAYQQVFGSITATDRADGGRPYLYLP